MQLFHQTAGHCIEKGPAYFPALDPSATCTVSRLLCYQVLLLPPNSNSFTPPSLLHFRKRFSMRPVLQSVDTPLRWFLTYSTFLSNSEHTESRCMKNEEAYIGW
jgi:hypothetical protein